MKALVIGATGATGKDLVDLLLTDDSFDEVDIFVRRSVDITHDKLNVHVIDFDQPDNWWHLVTGDVLFSCLGTTMKAAGSKENQWRVDYEYQYQFAKAARENGVGRYVLVSSDLASPTARTFYSRMKGKLEEAVKDLHYPRITIFHPPILSRKNSDRPLEVAGLKAIQLFNKVGIFSSQHPLPTEILAQAMIHAAKSDETGLTELKGKTIWERAGVDFE